MDSKPDTIIVGAGLAGLSAAAALAARGEAVTVFEAAAAPGGKAGCSVREGFTFDTGPSLLTMTATFDALYALCGEERKEHLEFIPLDPIGTLFWDDGTRLDYGSDAGRFGSGLETVLHEKGESLARYLTRTRRLWNTAAPLFLENALHEPSVWFSPVARKALAGLPWLAPFTPMHRLHSRYFRTGKGRQLFDRLATYNGSDPYRCPATLAIIAHAEFGLGGYAVRGGIRAIPRELEALAARHGARFRYNARVKRILTGKNRVTGVELESGEQLAAGRVICNADAKTAYETLLPGHERDPLARRYRRLEPSSSGLVFLWGMGASFPELRVNNVFFSADYRKDFRAAFGELRCPDDPTVYVNITGKTDPEDAPPGCENWFVLVNAPRDAGQDWAAETDRIRAAVTGKLSRLLGREIAPLIRTEEVLTPADIQNRTGSAHGSLYGIASNTALAAFLRHPNRHPRIRGLWFTGGSVHPGGGMPLAVRSGMITAGLIGRA